MDRCSRSQRARKRGAATVPRTAHAGASAETVTATLNGTDGAKVGTVTFAQEGSDVKVTLDAKGLTPGFHGFHVHQVAKCEDQFRCPQRRRAG